jgi:hypothetical protein
MPRADQPLRHAEQIAALPGISGPNGTTSSSGTNSGRRSD